VFVWIYIGRQVYVGLKCLSAERVVSVPGGQRSSCWAARKLT